MKKTDIVDLAVKILGLFLFIKLINTIVESGATVLFFGQLSEMYGISGSAKTIMILMSVFGLLFNAAFAILLTFGSKTITRKICSGSDYEENAKLFADKRTILEIATIVIGGFLLVFVLPDFVVQLNQYIKNVQMDLSPTDFDKSFLLTSFAKIVIAIFLLYQHKRISNLFVRKENLPEKEATE